MQKSKVDVRYLTRLAMLLAILLVMYYTPLGMIPTPGQNITLLTVPVAVGAALMGPLAGGIMGFVFGMLSLWRAFQTGTLIAMGVLPWQIFVLCVVTRTLMGTCVGWIYRLVSQVDKRRLVSGFAAGLSAPLLNTLFYMTVYVLILLNTPLLQQMIANTLGEGMLDKLNSNVLVFVAAYVGFQAVLEAVVGCLVAGVVIKALSSLFKR